MTEELRTRAVQDAIYAVVFGVGALALYTVQAYNWAHLVPMVLCLYNLIDLARVVGIVIRKFL